MDVSMYHGKYNYVPYHTIPRSTASLKRYFCLGRAPSQREPALGMSTVIDLSPVGWQALAWEFYQASSFSLVYYTPTRWDCSD